MPKQPKNGPIDRSYAFDENSVLSDEGSISVGNVPSDESSVNSIDNDSAFTRQRTSDTINFGKGLDHIGGVVSGTADGADEAVQGGVQRVSETVGDAAQKLTSTIQTAGQDLSNTAKDAAQAATNTVQGMIKATAVRPDDGKTEVTAQFPRPDNNEPQNNRPSLRERAGNLGRKIRNGLSRLNCFKRKGNRSGEEAESPLLEDDSLQSVSGRSTKENPIETMGKQVYKTCGPFADECLSAVPKDFLDSLSAAFSDEMCGSRHNERPLADDLSSVSSGESKSSFADRLNSRDDSNSRRR